ncbi:Peptidyl-prolyl cis-trans isomerase-like 4 [Mitosporidium daphniae]|uniref:peptidylprolyl isomerase n=1 Tax=Mitosporidium daphniae TaxID=1485682 RepID=A0A098VMR2_9MICR|nr:peptidyl-prolyl cis-trans isomerase Cyp6 [Mitosporidium daphniae]KGG50255.1 peptidyl-prolyl cis-trans isomerase Cyp6 [Mitosporidium daphniae]|eukprot:XP_013236682.1 peptidyl-prolyl cis-trans isomerase Cyp6 [Mitosporidium daphniae]
MSKLRKDYSKLSDAELDAAIEAARRARDASSRAVTLEILGDVPSANLAPPENVLFVCKLNPVTEDEDLELIFSRFGPIKSLEIIRNPRTGQSLQYAFIEYESKESCEEAYKKMENVLIDDRRIHVDFSQSLSKLKDYHVISSSTMNPRFKRLASGGGGGKSQSI